MVTKLHTFTNVSSKLLDQEKSRVLISIFLQDSETSDVEVYDTLPASTSNNYFARVYPGEILILSAYEGDDVTKSFWIRRRDSGTGAVYVREVSLDASVMKKLEEKGLETTQGLPYLILLAALAGS